MQLELLQRRGPDPPGGEGSHSITAAVARPHPRGGVMLEFGSADGPPALRLTLSTGEVSRLIATLHAVANDGHERVLLVDE